MASNKIQIRRSQSNSNVTGLSQGELAYTSNGGILYIGDPVTSAAIPIGGARTPGILIANQALVANSSGGIDRIISANLTVNRVNANNDWGTPGYVLTSAGTSGNVSWQATSGFGVDQNAQYTWANTQVFQNVVTFGATINGTANNSLYLGGVLAGAYVNSTYAAATYQTISGLAANVAVLTANNSNYLGGQAATYFAANSALSNYGTLAGEASRVALLTSNNAVYLGGVLATQYAYANSITPLQRNDTLAANVATLTANNANYLGGQYYTYYAANSALANYVTIGNFTTQVLGLTSNSTNFVGSVSAANVVSNAQLQANLANYTNTSGTISLINSSAANSANYLGGQYYTYYAANSALANYQTSAGLAANVAILAANNANYLGNQLPSYYTTNSALSGYVQNLTANTTNYVGVGAGSISAANVVSNTQLSSNLANYAKLSGSLFTGTVNATSYTTGGGYGVAATGVIVNSTFIAIGNTSVNGAITSNSTTVYFTGTTYSANNSAYLGGTLASSYATTSYVDAAVYNATGGAATQAYVDGKAAQAYANAQTLISNDLVTVGTQINQAYANAMADTLARNASYTGQNQYFGNTTFVANVSAANIYATSITANSLTILGTLTTVDTNTLVVKDNLIKVADYQANSATYLDSLDFGLYGTYGNTANVWFSGVYRDSRASSSSGRKDVWRFFSTKLEPTDPYGAAQIANSTQESTYSVGTLGAYLEPHGPLVGSNSVGGFLANSTVVTIQANSSFSVNIKANTINLSTALYANNGGTGQTSFSTGDILYAGSSSTLSKLSIGTVGQVLQISASNLPYYDVLDGGSF